MSKRDEEQNATPSASPARGEERNTIREESLEDFSPEWCQNLLNDPSYEQVNHGTRIADGSLNSLIGKTLFTDHTIRAIRVLCKPEDKSKGTSGELLALMSLGDEMCSYPNTLHGGINTTLLGEVGGALAGRQTSSSERITAVNFNVNLRKSVRAPGIVLVRAWMERPPEGRKIWVKCRTEQDGVTCIESENLYLKVNVKGKL